MKKIYTLTSALVLFTISGFAQIISAENGTYDYKLDNTKINYSKAPSNTTKQKVDQKGWLSVVDLRSSGGATLSGATFQRLFPDSFTYILPDDGSAPFGVGFHAIGTCFDPTDPLYSVQTSGWSVNRFDKYNVDSVRFAYAYVRETDSIGSIENRTKVIDTLFFHYLAPASMNRFYFNDKAVGGFGIPQGLDRINLKPTLTTFTDTILLDENFATDTSRGANLSIGRLTIPIPAGIGAVTYDFNNDFGGLPVGASITYKPGIPYAFGDTIISFNDAIKLKTQFNDFGTVVFSNSGLNITDLAAYNNAFTSNRQVRYGQAFGSVSGHLPITKNFGWTFDVLVDFDFFISEPAGQNWGNISDINKVNAYVYPNPVNSGSEIIVKLAEATSISDVKIVLTNILGNVINTNSNLESGDTYRVSTNGLTAGVYFVNITTGSKSGTYKVIVN